MESLAIAAIQIPSHQLDDPADNAHHQAVHLFPFSAFWAEEQVFLLSHWKDSLVCLAFLVSLEVLKYLSVQHRTDPKVIAVPVDSGGEVSV